MTSNPGLAAHPGRTNRLAREKSPYLLQHAHNPVDWFAWNDEAFQKSRRENKPIFLSIGYSTCHWCHVMERESFEDENVAIFLNRHFVSIKVDREERPDVDRIYMKFVQASTGQGGWPLNVFLTPELKPFFGGTYFPPEQRHGRPGLLQVLQHIQQLWEQRRDDLTDSASEIQTRLERMTAMSPAGTGPKSIPDILRNAGLLFKQAYDPRHGGFGGAPKFPQPSQPRFLLRYGTRFRDEEAIGMVMHTCDRMAAGGVHDQLGGGFARYSVDAQWLVPHFEKMLYDNAQLAQLYLDAFLVSRDRERGLPEGRVARTPETKPRTPNLKPETNGAPSDFVCPSAPEYYSGIARDILEYVLRDMTHPEGGFYSAEDADSEGHEGKFYCWTRAELEQLLSPEEFAVAVRYFGITGHGNFVDHSHPAPLPNQNVLSVVSSNLAARETPVLASAKRKMLEARNRRVRPHRDDKVLASWNGLMLGAFARAYAVLGEERYRAVAEQNLAFIQQKLWIPGRVGSRQGGSPRSDPTGRAGAPAPRVSGSLGESDRAGILFHRWREGERDKVQLLEGYAFLLDGVIDLYEATLELRHLGFALALAESLLAKFFDTDNGGFWQTVVDAPDLILRVKEVYDGAEPSGNSVAVMALLKLGVITGRNEFTAAAEKSLRLFGAPLSDLPQAVTCLLQALDFSLQGPKRVVVAGDPASAKGRDLLRAIHSVYQPNKVVLGTAGAVEEFARSLPAKHGPATYLCEGSSCQAPTSDPEALKQMLR